MTIEYKRYNVYARDQWVADFVIPSESIAALTDEYWETDIRSVIERIMRRSVSNDVVAVYDNTFRAEADANFSRGPITAYVYTQSSAKA